MSNQSENINELAKALSHAQAEMSFAMKDSTNQHFKQKYADLTSVWDAIRDPLTKHGLSVSQLVDIQDGKAVLVSILMHTSGQWLRSIIPILNANNTSQGQGAGITYVRRYSLAALVGCTQDDDDGEASMNRNSKEEKPKKETKPEKEEKITKEQMKELTYLADQCDPEYLNKVHNHLESLGYDGYDGITQKIYPQVINGMRKNAEKVRADNV